MRMENARNLDERLRRIIKEISRNTGGEIKTDLLKEFEARWLHQSQEQNRESMVQTLKSLKQAIDKL